MRHLTSPSAWAILSPSLSHRTVSLSRTLQGGQCFTWRCVLPTQRVVVSGGVDCGNLHDSDVNVNNKRGSGAIAAVSPPLALSASLPSFIGSFGGDVVQLGIDADSGLVIARRFASAAPICFAASIARARGEKGNDAKGRVITPPRCSADSNSVLVGAPVDEALRQRLVHYFSAEEDLGALLHEWRRSGHPITSLLPPAPAVGAAPAKAKGAAGAKRGRAGGSTTTASVADEGTSDNTGGALSTSTLTDSPVRLLRQDFVECFFSFLCSQNNNVKRIASLVLRLAEMYGTPIGYVTLAASDVKAPCAAAGAVAEASPPAQRKRGGRRTEAVACVDGKDKDTKGSAKATTLQSSSTSEEEEVVRLSFSAFPSLAQLKEAIVGSEQKQSAAEAALREAGFGYRARYVVACANALTPAMVNSLQRVGGGECEGDGVADDNTCTENGLSWYDRTLRRTEDKRRVLTSLCGVGRKVADCVLLFSLGERALVPIDTHMAQLAAAYFAEELRRPSSSVPSETRKGKQKQQKQQPAAVAKGKTSVESPPPPITLTPAMHDRMQACFLRAFGREAGWAHSFLFAERIGEQNTA